MLYLPTWMVDMDGNCRYIYQSHGCYPMECYGYEEMNITKYMWFFLEVFQISKISHMVNKSWNNYKCPVGAPVRSVANNLWFPAWNLPCLVTFVGTSFWDAPIYRDVLTPDPIHAHIQYVLSTRDAEWTSQSNRITHTNTCFKKID